MNCELMRIRQEIKTAIFDCDGVLFDSNHIKSESFAQTVASESPDAIASLLAYHADNGGVSRFRKFEWFYRDFLAKKDWEDLAQVASDRFSQIVLEKLMLAPMVDGTELLLQNIAERGINCFVVSAGAHDEVNMLINYRGISSYFVEVLGSPTSKIDHLARLENEARLVRPGVFIGDAISDLRAAEMFGLEFIFVAKHTLWSEGEKVCKMAGWPVVRDLTEIRCV
jgi:phosphoglycolate phosphatase-like HAD superfamily hydrolase